MKAGPGGHAPAAKHRGSSNPTCGSCVTDMEVSRGARGRDVGCGVAGVTEEKLMMDGVKGFVDYGVDCVFGCLACVGAVWVGGDAHLVLSDHCTQRPHVHLVV